MLFSISANGGWIAFESPAGNLVSNDTNGQSDVFLRDILTGITTLVSVNTNGTVGAGRSFNPILTPDGGSVVFQSQAEDLAHVDANRAIDLFVR